MSISRTSLAYIIAALVLLLIVCTFKSHAEKADPVGHWGFDGEPKKSWMLAFVGQGNRGRLYEHVLMSDHFIPRHKVAPIMLTVGCEEDVLRFAVEWPVQLGDGDAGELRQNVIYKFDHHPAISRVTTLMQMSWETWLTGKTARDMMERLRKSKTLTIQTTPNDQAPMAYQIRTHGGEKIVKYALKVCGLE